MIRVDAQAAGVSIDALHTGAEDFDATVSRANPEGGDTGDAALILADVLALTTEVSLRLLVEVDTIAQAAKAAVGDMSAMENFAKDRVNSLNGGN